MSKIRYVALLRGINVGGKNLIKMDELRTCFEDVGFENVQTYIASGNVVFSSTKGCSDMETEVDKILEKAFNYRGPTVVLSAMDFAAIVDEAPANFGCKPDTYHSDVIFLKLPAKAKAVLQDVRGLRLKEGVDTAHAGSKALYFTRLSARRTSSRMGQIVRLPSYKSMTIRNWNTTKKLAELLTKDERK